jgi:ribose transport system substrate-binding protein
VVQTQNDDSARGALLAAHQAGRASDTLGASAGADTAAIEQLRTNPAWVAEGDPSVALWGKYLFAMAQAVADGVTPPALTVAPRPP